MKRIIRAFDCVLSVLLLFVFTFIIYGTTRMPDKMVVRNAEDRNIGKYYSVSSISDESVDFQSARS
ncbi:MAG: hypothetical protein K2K42_06355, partial [Eubacterium sp.]|nr:hypothetical protein [Eubacterium sp.]